VTFVCVEQRDDKGTPAAALREISALADMIKPKNGIVIIPFAHLSSELADPQKARATVADLAELVGNELPRVSVASFGTHKDFYLESMLAYGHAGSVAFREVPNPKIPRPNR
jgi:threonyl-tRNA synthetase